MSVQFGAARVHRFLKGEFGPSSDIEAHKVRKTLQQDLKRLDVLGEILTADDQVQLTLGDVDVATHKSDRYLELKTGLSPSVFEGRVDGAKPEIRLSFQSLLGGAKDYLEQLKTNMVRLTEVSQLHKRLKRIQAHTGLQFNLEDFATEDFSNGCTKFLGSSGIQMIQTLVNLMEDPTLQSAFSKNRGYKQNMLEFKTQENAFDDYFKAHGGTVDVLHEDWAQTLFKTFEPTTLKGITFHFRGPSNLNFSLKIYQDAVGATLREAKEKGWGNPEAAKQLEVSFTIDELKEHPKEVKKRLIEQQRFWNKELDKVLR